jgi:hypothetical protein
MRAAGIHVVESPAMIGETMEKVLRRKGLLGKPATKAGAVQKRSAAKKKRK